MHEIEWKIGSRRQTDTNNVCIFKVLHGSARRKFLFRHERLSALRPTTEMTSTRSNLRIDSSSRRANRLTNMKHKKKRTKKATQTHARSKFDSLQAKISI